MFGERGPARLAMIPGKRARCAGEEYTLGQSVRCPVPSGCSNLLYGFRVANLLMKDLHFFRRAIRPALEVT